MKEGPDIARIAALIGDPARANILSALMTGKALTATELAAEAGVTAQTASSHLSKLEHGGLLSPVKQGRHKYFSLASDDVGHLLETLMGLAAKSGHTRIRTGPKDAALRKARVCYNHLAGEMGTQLFDSLVTKGHLEIFDTTVELTTTGATFVRTFGIDIDTLKQRKTPLCKSCLDWSERRTHLAGSLGRAFLTQFETMGWAKRVKGTRAVQFTQNGQIKFTRLIADTTQ